MLECGSHLRGGRRWKVNVPQHAGGGPGALYLDMFNGNPFGKSPGSNSTPEIMKSNHFWKVQHWCHLLKVHPGSGVRQDDPMGV